MELIKYQMRDELFKREEVARIRKGVEVDVRRKLKIEDLQRITQLNKKKLDESKAAATKDLELQQRKEESLRRHNQEHSAALLTAHLIQETEEEQNAKRFKVKQQARDQKKRNNKKT